MGFVVQMPKQFRSSTVFRSGTGGSEFALVPCSSPPSSFPPPPEADFDGVGSSIFAMSFSESA